MKILSLIFPALAALLVALLAAGARARKPLSQATILRSQSFGARGDGVTDDGPAVQKMLDAAATASGPVRLQFAPARKYLLRSGRNRYAFFIDGAHDLTLDGAGSLFLIDAQQRFLKLIHSRDVTVRGFKVDYVPLPFADGTIVAKDKAAGTIDVRIDAGQAMPPAGGATRQDGEQAFFGALWAPGTYNAQGDGGAYWMRSNFDVLNISAPSGNRMVRVQGSRDNGQIDGIELGKWRFSVPVRGIAHRYGPGESFQLSDNANLTLQDIELWSAPWFGFGINGSRGRVVFRRVNVRPRPGTARMASAWRDGFHVKNNRAGLLWEECIVQGNGDDAFNIAEHTSRVREVCSATRVKISQSYPLGVAAMEPGDALVFYSEKLGKIVGRARIERVDPAHFTGAEAPLFTIDLDAPLAQVEAASTLVWNEASGNPNTVLRRCRMDTSCRFRSPITIDSCQINALAWFTGDDIEAPIPSDVAVVNSQFRLGQGNPNLVIAMGGPGAKEPVISNVLFEGNLIWGEFELSDARNVALIGNGFADGRRPILLNDVANVLLRGNTHAGQAIAGPRDVAARNPDQLDFDSKANGSLMAPAARFSSVDAAGQSVQIHAFADAARPVYEAQAQLGGVTGAAWRVPVPALEAGAPTYFEALAGARFKTLEFSTFVAQGAPECFASVITAPVGHSYSGKLLLWQKLTAGSWQRHRVALGLGGTRSLRIGLGTRDKPAAASIYLGGVRLLP